MSKYIRGWLLILLLAGLWGSAGRVAAADAPHVQPLTAERQEQEQEKEKEKTGVPLLPYAVARRMVPHGTTRLACDPAQAAEAWAWRKGEMPDDVVMPAYIPADPLAGYDIEWYRNICVSGAGGVGIAGNLFLPLSPDPNETFPVIIFANSWALDEYEYFFQARDFAQEGFIVYSYSARGWGNSGGLIGVAGPDDMADVSANIDWILSHAPANPDQIGMSGISYGGGMSLLAAAHDSRIKTVVAMSSWADLRQSLFGGDTPRSFWGNILVVTGNLLGNMDPAIEVYYNNLIHYTNVEETLAWAEAHSPVSVLEEIQVPVYIMQNMGDELFQPTSLLHFYSQLQGPDPYFKKLDINLGIHATAELPGLTGLSSDIWDRAHDWFRYWLQGVDTGILEQPPVHVRLKNADQTVALEDWPSAAIATRTWYLSPRHGLSGSLTDAPEYDPDTDTIHTAGLFVSGATTGIPIVTPLLEQHTPFETLAWIPLIRRDLATVYESSSLSSDMTIVGIPTVELWVQPELSRAQLIAHLYDVDALGIGTLITHGPMTLHEAAPGQPVRVTFEMVAVGYQMPAGHHLVLAIDTEDDQYGSPTDAAYDVTFHYDLAGPPLITVPYVANP